MSPFTHTGNLFQRQTHPANVLIWILKTNIGFYGRMSTRTVPVSREKQCGAQEWWSFCSALNEAFFQHEMQPFPGTLLSH